MPQRQLNVRSDEAAQLAAALAKRLGKTTTQVVEDALRAYENSACPVDERGFTPEQRRRYDAISEAAREIRKHVKPGMSFDDSWMYDENGLPK